MELMGKHLIAGEWTGAAEHFSSDPADGEPRVFAAGTVDLVDRAAQAAEDAFDAYSATTAQDRAAFLNAIADEVDARIDTLALIGTQETGLPDL